MNRHDREQAEDNQGDYNAPDNVDTSNIPNNPSQGMGGGDAHPAVAQYDNVSKMH